MLFVWGFTGPSQAPPGGSGLIHAVNGNVGISTSTPGYKLTVDGGNISAAFNEIVNVAVPTASTSAATKGYVDAAAGAKSIYLTSAVRAGNHNCDDTPANCCASGYHLCYANELYGRTIERTGTGRAASPGNTRGDVRTDANVSEEDCTGWSSVGAGIDDRTYCVLFNAGLGCGESASTCGLAYPQWCCQD